MADKLKSNVKKKKLNRVIPVKRALFWIVLSTIFVSGTAFGSFLFFRYLQRKHVEDESFKIVAIVQTGPEKEALKTVFLAELLELSVDRSANLFSYNTQKASEALKSCPLIREAFVQKIKPGTLYIDYTVRKPVAFLSDFTNTAIDKEGIPIPFKPFFPPKNLPLVVLGLPSSYDFEWGKNIGDERMQAVLSILDVVSMQPMRDDLCLKQVDVSKVFAMSFGNREVVVVFEKQSGKEVNEIILRLNPKDVKQGLANFLVLNDHLDDEGKMQAKIVDLRIPQLAFILK